jgi:hypothetical protein
MKKVETNLVEQQGCPKDYEYNIAIRVFLHTSKLTAKIRNS